jgi:hypothetical protein
MSNGEPGVAAEAQAQAKRGRGQRTQRAGPAGGEGGARQAKDRRKWGSQRRRPDVGQQIAPTEKAGGTSTRTQPLPTQRAGSRLHAARAHGSHPPRTQPQPTATHPPPPHAQAEAMPLPQRNRGAEARALNPASGLGWAYQRFPHVPLKARYHALLWLAAAYFFLPERGKRRRSTTNED